MMCFVSTKAAMLRHAQSSTVKSEIGDEFMFLINVKAIDLFKKQLWRNMNTFFQQKPIEHAFS